MSILSRKILIFFRKPSKNPMETDPVLGRTMLEKNKEKESTPGKGAKALVEANWATRMFRAMVRNVDATKKSPRKGRLSAAWYGVPVPQEET